METRKESLSVLKLCRFCLSQDDTLTTLYERKRAPKNTVSLPLKILSSMSIEVFPSDKMPTYICQRCKFFMDVTYEFKQMCRQADENILQFVQKGTALDTIQWPAVLTELYPIKSKRSSEFSLMETVEGGATVQVTTHDGTDSEDEENLIDIKLGDGSDEGLKGTSIKLVPATDEDDKTKATRNRKGFQTVSKLVRHVRSHAGERAYPCKYCDKSFLKSHHYTRHLRLKHRELARMPKERMEEPQEQYRCEQCEDSFTTQDDLIYHSAIHATQNLICPLCQEKFEDVEAVTAHIKSHVNGTEFMCDYCELVFTTQEKLHYHMINAHDDEIRNAEQEMEQDDSSMDMELDEEDDENAINVKEESDHMVVEIKKAREFMLSNEPEDKNDNTNSEESETETTYTELATVDTLTLAKETPPLIEKPPARSTAAVITKMPSLVAKQIEKGDNQTASILRKAEDMKRKFSQHQPSETSQHKKVNAKSGTSSPAGANDKSLRLLEKELQELKRTNTRASDTLKTPGKNVEILKSKRPQIHTSTPKPTRTTEEKKSQAPSAKAAALEKKQPDRRVVTKENKEPKEPKTNNTSAKEDKEKEKEKVTPKNNVKNGAEENVRRSTRPSKIKDYAKLVNDRAQDSDDDNGSDYNEDSDHNEIEQSVEPRPKIRRVSLKQAVKATPSPATDAAAPGPKKRGRPRKDRGITVAKVRKEDTEKEEEEAVKLDKSASNATVETKEIVKTTENTEDKSKTPEINASPETVKTTPEKKPPTGNVLVSPTGQTLKKVPIKALPPGIKPLPLPANARPVTGGEVCEMQIGKKMVKVQKIVMTKAEVEAMAKKGLVEMKDGTMVLKQGIKLPTSDPAGLKSSLVGEINVNKESPTKKGAPTRCDLEEA
ncbi:hypothetical protein K1T71_003295 [Dendrolimus kikuchii]|uniref:Uncharacterized protein n=1 Tax=Dendrolimus kikuchii TaxID=765133 RepID=A0ACC1DBK6_9NEOP|nr:hypothetical protein K1T71_003295 [Dendrolimus kikuchii]